MTSASPATRVRAAVRRAKAGGERFLSGVLPGASARRFQAQAFADEWAAANLDAQSATGPLWVVLGDSASQGIGATTREVGYVGVVHELLRRRDAWRVINLSRAGAGVADVLGRQLPELAQLTAREPAALVTCLIGGEDVARRVPGLEHAMRQVLAALPSGSVVATIPSPAAASLNGVIREEAARHRMRLADLRTPGRSPVPFDDVTHAAWARAVITAVDGPPAESGPVTDPELPVVTAETGPPTDPQLPVVTAETAETVETGPATDPALPVVPAAPESAATAAPESGGTDERPEPAGPAATP